MLLSEKELERLIYEEWQRAESPKWCAVAARAIAERLREAIVWEGESTLATILVHDGSLTLVVVGEGGPLLKLIRCTSLRKFEAERVHVIVTTENALQTESKAAEVDGEEGDADNAMD